MKNYFRIAVVEDEKLHAEMAVTLLETCLAEREAGYCIREFSSAQAFLFEWEQNQAWDALFIDIQMPGLNGMELARKIREENRQVSIIFVTGMTDYLQEGYEVEALYYLIKPVDEKKMRYCVERIFERLDRRGMEKTIVVEAEAKDGRHVLLKILPREIVYIEAFAHNTELHAKESVYCVREGIGMWQKCLPGEEFVSCHRSYLVNLLYVSRLEKNTVVLEDGSELPLSRRSYAAVNQAFIKFYRRE